MKLSSSEIAYNEKLSSFVEWYNQLITKNRLLLLVEGSESLQNLLMDSIVVNVFSKKSNSKLYTFILKNHTYGLWKIDLDYSFQTNSRKISFKPFTGFVPSINSYVEFEVDSKDRVAVSKYFPGFNSKDGDISKRIFGSEYEALYTNFQSIYYAKESLIHSEMNRMFQNKVFMKFVKDSKGVTKMKFQDGFILDSPEEVYNQVSSSLNKTFLSDHSAYFEIGKKQNKRLYS